jgi:hypothetical protein
MLPLLDRGEGRSMPSLDAALQKFYSRTDLISCPLFVKPITSLSCRAIRKRELPACEPCHTKPLQFQKAPSTISPGRIKHALAHRRLRQQDLASLLGVTQQLVSGWLTRGHRIPEKHVPALRRWMEAPDG